MSVIELKFVSEVPASEFVSEVPASEMEVWPWITSAKGISTELRPILRMTTPRRIEDIFSVDVIPGKRLFRSYVFLFGVIPIDYSDITLLEVTQGVGFVEQSPMGSMKVWRHQRYLQPTPQGCLVTDLIKFEPRFAKVMIRWFVERLFRHRHAVLRRRFG
jgi:ligand-binding SRPBCC domain-containing protein